VIVVKKSNHFVGIQITFRIWICQGVDVALIWVQLQADFSYRYIMLAMLRLAIWVTLG